MSVSAVLSGITATRRALEQARKRYDRLLASNFNTFDFIQPKENRLSQILAWLLDPKGSHSQGDLFLDSFLNVFEIRLPKTSLQNVLVSVEHPTHLGRRIDILISDRARSAAIAIETKVWAPDQPRQVCDYVEYISHFEHYRLIYLTPSENRFPSEISIDADRLASLVDKGIVKTISWQHIAQWLQRCQGECQASRVQSFIQDFRLYILMKFAGFKDMTEVDEITQEIFRSPESVESAIKISNAWPSIQTTLIDEFDRKIRLELPPELTISGQLKPRANKDLLIIHKDIPDWVVAIGFDDNGFRSCYYGVRPPDDVSCPESEKRRVFDLLSSRIAAGEIHNYEWSWAWWRHTSREDPFLKIDDNWSTTPDAWIKMRSGELASDIILLTQRIFGVLAEPAS